MSRTSSWKPSEIDHSSTLAELLRIRATSQPGIVGYTFLADGESERDSVTYDQLDLRSRAIAAWLQKAELAYRRALLLYPPGLDLLSAFFGCLYSGIVPIPYSLSHLR